MLFASLWLAVMENDGLGRNFEQSNQIVASCVADKARQKVPH